MKRHDISQQLEKAISDSKLSHYKIAKIAGISPEQIDRFMSGERDLRLATAAKIAMALDLRLESRQT